MQLEKVVGFLGRGASGAADDAAPAQAPRRTRQRYDVAYGPRRIERRPRTGHRVPPDDASIGFARLERARIPTGEKRTRKLAPNAAAGTPATRAAGWFRQGSGPTRVARRAMSCHNERHGAALVSEGENEQVNECVSERGVSESVRRAC